jgi:isocitrate lyase
LGGLGYKFQFITLAGFHALNHSMFELARGYKNSGMTAYCRLQDEEFKSEDAHGYEAVKHQQFVGTGYFDAIQKIVTSGTSSAIALEGSTEASQFADREPVGVPQLGKSRD